MASWSLLNLFQQEEFYLNILDIGAALGNERPSYQTLVDAGRARIIGFEPNAEACARLNREYGEPHHFYPYFIGDGKKATFHETNWNQTGSLYEPNTPLVDYFNNLSELMVPMAKHEINTMRSDDILEISDIDFVKNRYSRRGAFRISELIKNYFPSRYGPNRG